MKAAIRKPGVQTAALICLCFLLSSTGWLSWEYHLIPFVPAVTADICTMVIGYLLQAAGIGIVMMILRFRPGWVRPLFPAVLILHLLFMVPAVISPYTAGVLVFGFLMNLCCGLIAGLYLFYLTAAVDPARKAATFGFGYGVAILLQWLMSLTWKTVYYSEKVLLICAVITGAVLLLLPRVRPAGSAGKAETEEENAGDTGGEEQAAKQQDPPLTGSFLLLTCGLVFLFSLINSSGFAFPAADVLQNVNVELSRMVYAAGLIIAGIAADKNRKYGAICALAALMMPFIILALQKETVSTVIFWALSYFTFGFYAVYILFFFLYIASEKKLLYLSGFGLMIGRAGDAVGEAFCLLLSGHMKWLIGLTAALFMVAVFVFFRVYGKLYVPEIRQEQSEKEKFMRFAVAHDLSSRERDMLRLLLEGKTNVEIAAALSISENTVKFHIRNLLQKTGCRNRNELIASYTNNINA